MSLRVDGFSEGGSVVVSPTESPFQPRLRSGSDPMAARRPPTGQPLFVSNTWETQPPSAHPLAVFSASAAPQTLSPRALQAAETSPRGGTTMLEKSASAPGSVTLTKSRLMASLKRLTLRTSGDAAPGPQTTRDRSATVDDTQSPRSLPGSPRASDQGSAFDMPKSRINKRATITADPVEVARVFAALRAGTDDDDNSSQSSVDDVERFAKAVAGHTGCGASVIFDLEDSSDERRAPMARVRSSSSVSELRRRLADEGTFTTPPSSASTSASGSNSSQSSGSLSPPIRRTADGRDYELRKKKIVTSYTLIDYNPDVLMQSPWQTFLVPNKVITPFMRTLLERAHRSDQFLDPHRICTCTATCRDHALPDAVAKLGAVFAIDSTISVSSPEMKIAVKDLTPAKTGVSLGSWACYRIPEPRDISNSAELNMHTNFESTPITHRYRFKKYI